jgi:cytochrome c556
MKAIFSALAVAAAVAGAPAALAQDGAIFTRQMMMNANDNALTMLTEMAEGKVPFDGAVARAALAVIAANLEHLPNLTPAASIKDPSNALPAVNTNRAAFVALATKMVADARAAAMAATSANALRDSAAFKAVAANCDACHMAFRNF